MSQPITGEIVKPEEYAREKFLAQAIVTALGEFITNRIDDLPHRFKTPSSFGEYMSNWGVNQTYHSVPIHGNNAAMYMTMEMTNRPSQGIFEIVFQGADGMRLFTLELEYDRADDTKVRR